SALFQSNASYCCHIVSRIFCSLFSSAFSISGSTVVISSMKPDNFSEFSGCSLINCSQPLAKIPSCLLTDFNVSCHCFSKTPSQAASSLFNLCLLDLSAILLQRHPCFAL